MLKKQSILLKINMKRYAGIGSRKTPIAVCALMQKLAFKLDKRGYICSTGGAIGADQAFMNGATNLDLWLPFNNYNGYKSNRPLPTANEIAFASRFHPNWDACSDTAKLMHARNGNIILGEDVDDPNPVDFVVCWTPFGEIGGGTGQALKIAEHYKIPVFNLGKGVADELKKLLIFLNNS